MGRGGIRNKVNTMQKEIHPSFNPIKVSCSCGNSFETFSTLDHDLAIEVCSSCHPFYTGKQKLVDTERRVDGFMKKYGSFSKMAKKGKAEGQG